MSLDRYSSEIFYFTKHLIKSRICVKKSGDEKECRLFYDQEAYRSVNAQP